MRITEIRLKTNNNFVTSSIYHHRMNFTDKDLQIMIVSPSYLNTEMKTNKVFFYNCFVYILLVLFCFLHITKTNKQRTKQKIYICKHITIRY